MIILGLGTNLGDRNQNLRNAIDSIKSELLCDITESSIIESEPLLPENAPDDWNIKYLNMAIGGELKSQITPHEFLHKIKEIESKLGRTESPRWSPRIIDIDILIWDDLILYTPDLQIPHIGLSKRDFALRPLLEIMPTWHYPTKIFGILNLTPDSFSDGGKNPTIDDARAMISQGAFAVDIGAESTRPNAETISLDEEWNRLESFLDSITPSNSPYNGENYSALISPLIGGIKGGKLYKNSDFTNERSYNPNLTDRAKSLRLNSTEVEKKLWSKLRAKQLSGHKFRRQEPLGNYIVDFINLEKKLIVELDGGQHSNQQSYDTKRSNYFIEQGYKILRFWNHEVTENIDGVLQIISRELNTSPNPSYKEGGYCGTLPLIGGDGGGISVSLDTRNYETAKKALNYPCVKYLNDVCGFNDERMVQLAAQSGIEIIVMHSLTVPADKNIVLQTPVIPTLKNWMQEKFSALTKAGIAPEKIIFDPGIGFGKTADQSQEIVRSAADLADFAHKLGCKILYGHSRKSFLNVPMEKRDIETAAISRYLCGANVDFIRVHNVEINQKTINGELLLN